LKHGGTIICIPSGTSENITEKASARGLHGYHFRVLSDGHDMKEIAGLLGKGILKSFVSKTFTFGDIQAAHEQIETGKTKGKIVIAIGQNASSFNA
jgi:NADPH:quinone reductase-like Zn-dependent oxidoreductase